MPDHSTDVSTLSHKMEFQQIYAVRKSMPFMNNSSRTDETLILNRNSIFQKKRENSKETGKYI